MDLQKLLAKYRDWTGSRIDLLSIIKVIEQEKPKARMLQSKKAPYDLLPINARRIQWFVSKGIIPKPDGHRYNFEHFLFYWVAITLRKRDRLQFSQIEGLAQRETAQSAEEFLLHPIDNNTGKRPVVDFNLALSEELIKMGRVEGRPLISRPLRLSLTPWCQVILNQSQLEKLSVDDVSVLAEAFRVSLTAEIFKSEY
jgi:hypothetical protein